MIFTEIILYFPRIIFFVSLKGISYLCSPFKNNEGFGEVGEWLKPTVC